MIKWGTTEEMLKSAKIIAETYDDLAVKAEEHSEYSDYKGLANLLRAMSVEIKRLEELAEIRDIG